MHLVEISIFSLNNVAVRPIEIMINLLEHLKILFFKVIFSAENWWNISKKNLKNIGLRNQLLLTLFLENFDF